MLISPITLHLPLQVPLIPSSMLRPLYPHHSPSLLPPPALCVLMHQDVLDDHVQLRVQRLNYIPSFANLLLHCNLKITLALMYSNRSPLAYFCAVAAVDVDDGKGNLVRV
jgi:hypothetical protein